MTSFSDKPWSSRFLSMGDASERKWLEYCDGQCERVGLDRPEGIHVPSLPARVRAAPDFLVTSPEPAYVECMGIGRKQILQIKLEKWGVLRYWNDLLPVKVWCWDSYKKRSGLIDLDDLDHLIQTPNLVQIVYFDGRKLAFGVPADPLFGLCA